MPSREVRELLRSTRRILGALLELAGEREDLRSALRSLAHWVADELDDAERPRADAAETGEREPTAPPQSPAPPPPPAAPPVALTLAIGDTHERVLVPHSPEALELRGAQEARRAEEEAGPPEPPPAPFAALEVPLSIIIRRARLKAQACRWAIERRRRIAEGAEHNTAIKPSDERLVGEARSLPDCFLWMLDPYHVPADAQLERLAGAYDNVALAADLAAEEERKEPDDGPAEDALSLIAEALSALRAGLEQAGFRGDRDQDDLFGWLRRQTFEHNIYVARHMKLDDPADPAAWLDLRERFDAYAQRHAQRREQDRLRTSLHNKVRYHLTRLRDDDEDAQSRHWATIVGALEEWVGAGFAPSDRALCELLAQQIDDLPPEIDVSPALDDVLEAVDELIARRQTPAPRPERVREAAPPRPRSPELTRAADLLRGRTVLLIGGEMRRGSKEILERDLELKELRWLSTSRHQSLSDFEPEIARPEVDVIIRAVRWTSHMHADLRGICDRYGKPFVNLPSGYGSNQVAKQVLEQVSGKLAISGRD